MGPRRGLSAITAKRGLIRASPLFLLTLALTLLVPHVYAPFGDGQLGFAVAQSSQGGALHFGGNTATAGNIANLQAVFMNNTLGDGFVSGVVTYVGDSTFFCGNDATFLATFVPGYNPSLTGQSGIAPGNVYTITQAISNAPCNSGSAGGLSGSEYTVPQQTFVRLGQWVGWVIYSNSATISAVDGGGLQCKTGSQTGPTYFDVSNSGGASDVLPVVGQSITSQNNVPACNVPSAKLGGIDLTFSSGGGSTQSQCLGNCNPTISTNSTQGINFNVSQTIFYAQQVTHDGVVTNVTATVGKNYTAIPSYGMILYLGLYSATCQSPLDTPFTANCPGFLVQFKDFRNPNKGLAVLSLNYQVAFDTYIGIGFSASRNGLVLNDTTATAPGFSANGIFPTAIQSPSSIGPIRVRATATVIFGPGSSNTNSGGCSNQVTCGLNGLVNALGGGVIGGLLAWLILFGFCVFGIVMVTKTKQRHGDGSESVSYHFPQGLFVIIAMVLMFILSAAGALPVWVPIVIVLAVVWLFTTEVLWNRRHSGGTGGGM